LHRKESKVLTKEEEKILLDTLADYPEGVGEFWFSNRDIEDVDEAVKRIIKNPNCVKYG